MIRTLLSLILLIGLAAGGVALYKHYVESDSERDQFRTEKVVRGDLQINVRATGTVEPEETVDIGAQVVGRIKQLGKDPRGLASQNIAAIQVDYAKPLTNGETPANEQAASTAGGQPVTSTEKIATPDQYRKKKLGADSIGKSKAASSEAAAKTGTTKAHVATGSEHLSADPAFVGKSVDFGSPVIKGMVLAQIDPAVYQAQFDQASAALAQAKARVLQAQAMVAQTAAEWDRAQRLRELKIPSSSPAGFRGADAMPIKGISDADYVLAQANAESAKADLEAAKAAVLQQTATLALAKTNLDYTTIVSPIDGTIIARRVNVGQTVVSSLNAPSLFLIARDLRRMQVWASVNEADIAKVTQGTKVHFQVDALPQDTFHGTVIQRRLNAAMTQNVVTYTVVIDVDNSDLKLLPYLTADVYFEVDSRKNALLVPNGALRFKPTADQIDEEWLAENQEPADDEQAAEGAGHREKNETGTSKNGQLWVVVPESGKLRPVDVRTGVSDLTSSLTEITGGDIHEGDEIVLGEIYEAQAGSGDVTNPLAPPRFRRHRTQPRTQTKNQG
jgi:HlyD family secretion protein